MKTSSFAKTSIRAGHTLLELLLVLVILAVAFAMAIPTYESMVGERRLQKSAEDLEIQLQEARVKAMRTGQSQVFRFEVGENSYTCEPWLSGKEDMNAGPGAVIQGATGQAIQTSDTLGAGGDLADASKGKKNLETGIVFASANTTSDSRTLYAAAQEGGAMSVPTSTPVMFYPDGTATTAEVVLEDTKGHKRAIQIRGLTGRTKLVVVAATN